MPPCSIAPIGIAVRSAVRRVRGGGGASYMYGSFLVFFIKDQDQSIDKHPAHVAPAGSTRIVVR
eukprot:7389276-Prymnesium_polylepis.2